MTKKRNVVNPAHVNRALCDSMSSFPDLTIAV